MVYSYNSQDEKGSTELTRQRSGRAASEIKSSSKKEDVTVAQDSKQDEAITVEEELRAAFLEESAVESRELAETETPFFAAQKTDSNDSNNWDSTVLQEEPVHPADASPYLSSEQSKPTRINDNAGSGLEMDMIKKEIEKTIQNVMNNAPSSNMDNLVRNVWEDVKDAEGLMKEMAESIRNLEKSNEEMRRDLLLLKKEGRDKTQKCNVMLVLLMGTLALLIGLVLYTTSFVSSLEKRLDSLETAYAAVENISEKMDSLDTDTLSQFASRVEKIDEIDSALADIENMAEIVHNFEEKYSTYEKSILNVIQDVDEIKKTFKKFKESLRNIPFLNIDFDTQSDSE